MRGRKRLGLAGTVLVLAAAGASGALPTTAAGQGSEAEQTAVWLRYAQLRETLQSCVLEKAWDTLTPRKARRCRRLQRRYELVGWSGGYLVHCRTSVCIATPAGVHPANGPIPQGARVYR
jgi:hypothetical protein